MTDKDNDENLISHLEALRGTLLKCISALGIILIPMFFAAPKCLEYFIKLIIGNNNVVLNYFSPAEVFLIQIKMAFVLDLIVCFPYIAKQFWNFFAPALYEHEKKFISSIVIASGTLFVFGVTFCLFFILPLIIKFGMSFATSDIQAVFGISNVINLSLWLAVAFGLMFQFPLITYSLIKTGMISYKTISDKRPYVVVGILLLSAILTPPDIVSQIMLFLPTYALFEIGLLFSRFKKGKENESSNG